MPEQVSLAATDQQKGWPLRAASQLTEPVQGAASIPPQRSRWVALHRVSQRKLIAFIHLQARSGCRINSRNLHKVSPV